MTDNKKIHKSWILYFAAFLANFGIGLINFTLVFFVNTKFNAGSALIGWMSALWALAYLFGCLFLNNFREKLKPGRAIILAALVMGISVFFIPLLNSLFALIIIYMIFGLSTSLYWPPLMGWLSRGREGKKLGSSLAVFNLSWSSGVAVSPYIAGLIITQNISLPLYIAAGIYGLIVAIFFFVTLFIQEFKPHDSKSIKIEEVVDQSSPLRLSGWIGVFSAYLFYGTLLFVFPLFAKNEWQMSEDKIGLILLFRALVSVIGFQLSGYSKWWHHKKSQLLISQILLFSLAMLLVFNQTQSIMIIAIISFGFLFSHMYTNSIFHGVSGSTNREKRMAIHESALTIGVVFGSAGGGIIYENSTIQATFLFCGALVLLGLIAQIFSTKSNSDSKLAKEKRTT
ncbi:MAG: MFS transporter [Spirochaetaceae bacterium]|jgi:predicted MFS family arabinose efflux permease|nr:MFS transporter [Spirochaetaceae bacterium]